MTQPADGVFSFIGDNMSKGVSAVPAITFHANPAWSEAHWDDDVDVLGRALIDAAQPWLGDAAIVEHQVKKWRFATPRTISPDPCWTLAGRIDRRSPATPSPAHGSRAPTTPASPPPTPSCG